AGDGIALIRPLSQVGGREGGPAEGPVRMGGPGCSASAARTADWRAGDGLLGGHGRILASRPRHCQTWAGTLTWRTSRERMSRVSAPATRRKLLRSLRAAGGSHRLGIPGAGGADAQL